MTEKILNQAEKREENEHFSDLVIFTTTLYGEDKTSLVRLELAKKLFANAEKLGIKCVVLDNGSSKNFLQEVAKYKNVKLIIQPAFGMGEGRRRSLQEAMQMVSPEIKNPNFLWTEPEKDGLITKENLNAMINGLRNGSVDIVVPQRKNKDSYPKFQARIETRANKRAKELGGMSQDFPNEEIDLWFGPKMFNLTGAQYFLDYKGKLDKWDAIIKPVINAYKDGKTIGVTPVDFTYDQSQRKDEEGNKEFKKKRFEQYVKILEELDDKQEDA
ncbi:MAG: hypothetical protein Athens071424_82 [Parcubacteria group bacterium Athens0714_24]|nr:MAG: hypothetical protein Athens071424_82 [Parcubacteria group bacterium Athens0714_24]